MKLIKDKDTSTRQNLFIEVLELEALPDGNKSILGKKKRGILGRVIDVNKPMIPKNGGIGERNFIIITPKEDYFYAFDYTKDLSGWKQQIEIGAKKLGVRLAKIVDEKYFVISDGTTYPLIDCEFERYNFYYTDEHGERKLQKERQRIDKKLLFPEQKVGNAPYKTHQGKTYTQEEWEAYEQEQWEKYKKGKKK